MAEGTSIVPLIRVLRSFAMAIGAAVAVAVPVTFGLASYLDRAEFHRTSAHLSADQVARYAFMQGDSWRFSAHRVAELIAGTAAATNVPSQSVYDAKGSLVVGIGEPILGPASSERWPIVVQDQVAGSVVVAYSLWPLIWQVSMLAAIGGALGGVTYLCVHFLPVRALRRVTGELEAAQSALAASHTRLSEAIEALPDAFALYDAEDRLVMFNRRYLQLYSLHADAIVVGRTFEEVLRVGAARGQFADAVGREEAWIRERVEQHKTFDGVIEQRLQDGRWLRIVERSTAEGGRVGVRTDITELKQAEAERAALREQFHQAQHLQALGTLAGGVAHDFNNLLGIVIGHAEIVQASAPAESPWMSSIDEIIQAGERGAALVKQILAYTRREPGAFSNVPLSDLLRQELTLVRAALPATIELNAQIAPDAAVLGDPTQLHQVVMNLCVNAGHAIGSQPGIIDIELRRVEVAAGDPTVARLLKGHATGHGESVTPSPDGLSLETSLGDLDAGPYWRMRVRDSGCGMPRDVLQRIFEPFFTTREVGAGTGLGLSVTGGIVTGGKGAMLVRTTPGAGSVFDVYLPAAPASTATPAVEPAVAGAGRSRRVLFVDDEPALAEMATRRFTAAGYSVLAMTDPRAALSRFRAAPGDWYLVVTD